MIRQTLAVALGQFMARLHKAFYHDDLHPGNLLVRSPRANPNWC